jgi:hypothetical protein
VIAFLPKEHEINEVLFYLIKIIKYIIHLAQDGDQWHTLVNTVMKLQAP